MITSARLPIYLRVGDDGREHRIGTIEPEVHGLATLLREMADHIETLQPKESEP